MAGMIDQAQPKQQMDPKLAQIEQQIRAKIRPEDQSMVDRLFLAGKKFLYAPQTRDFVLGQIQKEGDPGENIAQGIASLISILDKEVRGQKSPAAYIPVAMLLLVEALDFVHKSGLMEVTDELISKATQDLMAFMMQKFGLNPDGSPNGQQGQQVGQQPEMQGAPQSQQPQQAPQGAQPLIGGA